MLTVKKHLHFFYISITNIKLHDHSEIQIISGLVNYLSQTNILGAVYMGAGTGHLPGREITRDPGMYVSIIFIAFRLHEAGTFFVPSRLGGISLSATGISAQAGRFLSYKCFIPPDRGNVNFLF